MDGEVRNDARGRVDGERFVLMKNRYADEDVRFSVGAENDNEEPRMTMSGRG